MKMNCISFALLVCLFLPHGLMGQDPTGVIEGQTTDRGSAEIAGAQVLATNLDTGFTKETRTTENGFFRLSLLPIGHYRLTIEAPSFAKFVQEPVEVNVSQTVRFGVKLDLATVRETITVTGDAALVDSSTNTLGKTVSGREILDLPLNGRNFTQLGLLQTGVAPLTSGVTRAGGTLRQGHAYAVNGMRPEANLYLLDGAQNINRMDGGYALKIPVDAIAEFRILTQGAPAEYGGTSGATTSVATRTGDNRFHGTLYEFLRNDKLDARNFFSQNVEPLKQNQFGGTVGGPLQKDRLFFFGYYEGLRNKQGTTNSATVPTPQERAGDFSGLGAPLINFAAGGVPFPNNMIPASAINPVALNVLKMYPLGNVSPSIYRSTLVGTDFFDQAGGRVDFNVSPKDQLFARYSYSSGYDINPISVRGSDVPGFPTRDNLTTQSAVLSSTHIFSSASSNSLRVTFFRHVFDFDRRLNRTGPRDLGFNYDPASALGQGPPFFNISGYSPIGGAITGPRDSVQNSYEVQEGFSRFRGAHSMKYGAGFLRTQLNMFQAIAPNAFFVFASTFPTNDAIANLLLGAPVTFYQGLGDFHRGLRIWNLNLYAQDEWRLTRGLTLNYGIRYERLNPISEIRNRLNGFEPGVQSVVMPNAPKGLLFPGDPGIGKGIAQSYNGFMPRIGFVWDPTAEGKWSIRSSYGIFYDQFQNGAGTPSQVPVSSLPWAQFNQYSGQGLNFADPYLGHLYPAPNTFVRPSTVFAIDAAARPPYAQHWNLGIQRSLAQYVLEVRYVGSKGTHLPRNVEANPAVYGPGANAQNADRRRIYANCPSNGGTCDFSTIAMLSDVTNSTYHSGQASLSRHYASGFAVNLSYWYSKSLDYLSSMNLSGAAAKPLAGENDLAQNPFNLTAEHGPSLFDARHRFVASGSWEPRFAQHASRGLRLIADGWQLNAIVTHNSPTPFTVSDSRNVSLQANSPPISGFAASRPDLVGDPNSGPHTVDQWISPTAFQRLDPQRQAGEFGNAGRNIARGPAFTDADLSLTRSFRVSELVRLQLRAESFNVANHSNFGLPVADLNSSNFGKILSAAPPRLMQLALKLIF